MPMASKCRCRVVYNCPGAGLRDDSVEAVSYVGILMFAIPFLANPRLVNKAKFRGKFFPISLHFHVVAEEIKLI
jgi:hypothetical protein